MNSGVIQAIRQTGCAIMFFFPLLNLQESNLHKRGLACWCEFTIWLPSAIACAAIQQGSSTLWLLNIEELPPHPCQLKTLTRWYRCHLRRLHFARVDRAQRRARTLSQLPWWVWTAVHCDRHMWSVNQCTARPGKRMGCGRDSDRCLNWVTLNRASHASSLLYFAHVYRRS